MQPKILFKFPSRGRPERFFKALDSIVNNVFDRDNYHVLCTLDSDDGDMNNDSVKDKLLKYPNLSIDLGKSESKIHAVNRGVPNDGWDILCVHSDDMFWEMYGFDTIIRNEFSDGGFDKLIHIPDNDAKSALATYYIAGKQFFNRFGYIYNPEFKSLWCDNLVMDISKILGCYRYVDCPGILFHANPTYGHLKRDEMYDRQQSDWAHDEAKYNEIKNRGYDIEKFIK